MVMSSRRAPLIQIKSATVHPRSNPLMRASPRSPLPRRLLDPRCYPHPVRTIRLIETHISWVLLTGRYAYKVKKPVDLGFAKFTTLAERKFCCEEELRLNRRLAPDLYLGVVPIRGRLDALRIEGRGRTIDYAVKMRQFPQHLLASRALAGGRFGSVELDELAATISRFHEAAPADVGSAFGTPAAVWESAIQNFDQMADLADEEADHRLLDALREWTGREHAGLHELFARRKSAGFIRECHGDLHLGNIVTLNGHPAPFDCIEFNPALRFIDVVSEIAFLVMDLIDRKRPDLAWRFLNRYLEAAGDYAAIPLLRFYMVYRALVRAKVHLMRAHEHKLARAEHRRLLRAFRDYLRLAETLAFSRQPTLILAHGLSGAGKTTATQPLIEKLGAIRLRSDLERKRMHGLAALAATRSGLNDGIYSSSSTVAAYRRLAGLSQQIIKAGYPVVVDATFLKRPEREAFRALAESLDVPYVILDFHVPLAVLRKRVVARRQRGDDASEADLRVLDRQIATREPLTPLEIEASFVVDGTRPPARQPWRKLVDRIVTAGHERRPFVPETA